MIPVSWISDYYTQIISLHLAVLSECFKILLAQVAEKVDELQCIYLVENYSVSYNIVLGSCSPTFRSWKEAKRFHLESISWSGKSNWCSDKTLQRGRGQILYYFLKKISCSILLMSALTLPLGLSAYMEFVMDIALLKFQLFQNFTTLLLKT